MEAKKTQRRKLTEEDGSRRFAIISSLKSLFEGFVALLSSAFGNLFLIKSMFFIRGLLSVQEGASYFFVLQ